MTLENKKQELRALLREQPPQLNEDRRQSVLLFLDQEINRIYLEEKRTGWTSKALLVGIGVISWILLQILGDLRFSDLNLISVAPPLFLTLFLIIDTLRLGYLLILPTELMSLCTEDSCLRQNFETYGFIKFLYC